MKRLFIAGLSLFLMLGGLMAWATGSSAAEENTGYSISVIKYKLEDPELLSDQLPLDGKKAGEIKDSEGNQLKPLAGISYEITRVSSVQGTNTFEKVVGDAAFSATVTTDKDGVARVSGLAQGMYRVVEKEHPQLRETMEPVVLELPLPQQTGKALSEVYLYPKSGVKTAAKAPETVKQASISDKKRLPQTSGNIGSYHSLLIVLGFLFVMGLIGFRVMKKFDFK